MIHLGESSNGHDLELPVGEVFELCLPENPTTEFRWQLTSNGEPACVLLSHFFEAPDGSLRTTSTLLSLGPHHVRRSPKVGRPEDNPTFVTLKRYTISTRTTTKIVTLPHTNIGEARISADGQWVLLHTSIPQGSAHPRVAIQLVRMDGQGLQTLYCSGDLGLIQRSPDNKSPR